jgi:hypothetical protein
MTSWNDLNGQPTDYGKLSNSSAAFFPAPGLLP